MKYLKHGKVYTVKKRKKQREFEKACKSRNRADNIIIFKDEVVEPLAPIWFDKDIENSSDAQSLIFQSMNKVYFCINGSYDNLSNDDAWSFINFVTEQLKFSDKQYQRFIAKNPELVLSIFDKLDGAYLDAMDKEYIDSEIKNMLERVLVGKEDIDSIEMFQ